MTIGEIDAATDTTVSSLLHLAEGPDGWTLTITVGPDLLNALNVAGVATSPIVMPQCRVHVEPNLLPAEPFLVDRVRVVSGTDDEPTSAATGSFIYAPDRGEAPTSAPRPHPGSVAVRSR